VFVVQATSLQLDNADKLPTLRIGFMNNPGSWASDWRLTCELLPLYVPTDAASVEPLTGNVLCTATRQQCGKVTVRGANAFSVKT